MLGRKGAAIALMCAALSAIVPTPAPAQEGSEFMPKGGKTLLIELLGSPPDSAALVEIAAASRSETEWSDALAERTGSLTDDERETLANYLAVNMPLAEGALDVSERAGDDVAALPPDGRELAWNACQFCHSLFASHLMIDRGVQGWRSTFETPFHREIELTDNEQETFARYSAINMPLKFEDVPEELRF